MNELQPLLSQCGVGLYDIEIANENGRKIYRIYITKQGGVSLDDCEAVSRLLSPIFDVTPPVEGDYVLEVSSPGLERKLEKPSHFTQSLGELVSIKTSEQTLKGTLVKASESTIAVQNNDGICEIEISQIKKAKTYLEW